MRALLAKMKAEIGFLVLLVVAVAGCWMYVQMRNARDDRDSLQHAAELLCTAAGKPFAAEGKLARGVACQSRIAALSKFESDAAKASAQTLADAMAAHDARQLADNLAARAAAEAARDAAHRMENADAEAERRNLVDREWTAAVNGVAGLRPTLAR